MRVWPMEALRESLGLNRPQMQAELDAIRGAFLGVTKPQPDEARRPAPSGGARRVAFSEEAGGGDGIAVRFPNMEDPPGLRAACATIEKVLNEKFAAGLARNALMTESGYTTRRLAERYAKGQAGRGGVEREPEAASGTGRDVSGPDRADQNALPSGGASAGQYTFSWTLERHHPSDSGVCRAQRHAADSRIFTSTDTQVSAAVPPRPRTRATGRAWWLLMPRRPAMGPSNWKRPLNLPC